MELSPPPSVNNKGRQVPHAKHQIIERRADVRATVLAVENDRLRAALKDIAIGCGDRVLTQEEMRARAFDALEQ